MAANHFRTDKPNHHCQLKKQSFQACVRNLSTKKTNHFRRVLETNANKEELAEKRRKAPKKTIAQCFACDARHGSTASIDSLPYVPTRPSHAYVFLYS